MKALFIFLLSFSIQAFAFDTNLHAAKVTEFLNNNPTAQKYTQKISPYLSDEENTILQYLFKKDLALPKLKTQGNKIVASDLEIEILELGKIKINGGLIFTYDKHQSFDQNLISLQTRISDSMKTSKISLLLPQAHALIIAPAAVVGIAAVVIATPIIIAAYYINDTIETSKEWGVTCEGAIFTVRQKVTKKYLPDDHQMREVPLADVNNIMRANSKEHQNFRNCDRANAKMFEQVLSKNQKNKERTKEVLDRNANQAAQ